MSDSNSNKPVSRRDTLKLASALGALGVGLGITLDGEEASAAAIKSGEINQLKYEAGKIGTLYLKLSSFDNKHQQVLFHELNLSAIALKLLKLEQLKGPMIIEVYNDKDKAAPELLIRDEIHFVQGKV